MMRCFWGAQRQVTAREMRGPCSPPAAQQRKCHSFPAAAFCHSSQKRAVPENCNGEQWASPSAKRNHQPRVTTAQILHYCKHI